jgi:D-alanyl-D-alanine carboxypeptidase
MTTDTVNPTKRTTRSLRTKALVLTTAAVLAGSGAAAAAAAAQPNPAQPSATQPNATRPAGPNGVMQDVARQVLGSGAPGYSARIDDGHHVALTVAGLADTATGRRLTSRDQFEIGSNTKTFMSTLALQLVDQHQLSLDAPVSKYLPGVVPNGQNITVRMLLNHTSGLFNYTADDTFFPEMMKDPQRVFTAAELLAVAFKHAPDFAPGTSWNYSNTNYVLIGQILQKQTGRTLPELVQQRIARPLGLKHTYFADPRATNTGPGYAHGYAITFAVTPPAYDDTSSWPIGGWADAAGAVISTNDDLSRFFSSLLGGKLFSRAQLNQMKTTVPLPAEFPIKGSYGLGLFKIKSPCGTVYGHGGDTLGHHSTAVVTADGRRTAVSDTTAEPADLVETAGGDRFAQVAFAAEDVTVCQMLDKPVPASVLDALHGTSPTATAAH